MIIITHKQVKANYVEKAQLTHIYYSDMEPKWSLQHIPIAI